MRLLAVVIRVRWRTSLRLFNNGSPRSFVTLIRAPKNCNDQIPWIKCGNTIQPQPCIKRNDFWFCWCAKRQFVSYTSNSSEQMYDFPKRTMFHPKWILNPQDLLRNRSLGKVPACIVWKCYPHNNTVCIECMKSIDSGVCHRLWSVLWLIVQVCSLTIEYQVFQYVPRTSISEQIESILLLTILQQISFLLLWNDGHRCMELILCRVVESSCLPTHKIVPHISWHDPPCHETMKKYEDFEGMVISLIPPQKFAIQTWFCNCPQYLGLLRIDVECSPSIHDPRKMLLLPNRLLCWVLSTSVQDFVSFQPIQCHPHTQIRIILFHDVQRDIPNWKPSPNRTSRGFSWIAFPTIVLPKDDRTASAQEEQLGLPYWTMT